MTKILVFGTENQTFLQLCQVADILYIQLKLVKNSDELKETLSQETFDAFIVMETLTMPPLEEVFSLLPKQPLALITLDEDESKLDFRKLKEIFQIPYIFEEPLQKEEAEVLFGLLTNTVIQTNNHISERIPENLMHSYQRSIPYKIERVHELIKIIQFQPDFKHINALKQDLHKLAGSSAPYGYVKVGELAREWECYLSDQLGPTFHPDLHLNRNLAHFLRILKLYFQHIYPNYLPNQTSPITSQPSSQTVEQINFFKQMKNLFTEKPFAQKKSHPHLTEFLPQEQLIYAIISDHGLSEILRHIGKEKKIKVLIENDPQKALDKLTDHLVKPSILFVEQNYPNSYVTSKDLISTLNLKNGFTYATSALILEHGKLQDEMEAINEGVNYILQHPIRRESIIHIIDQSLPLEYNEHFKVLIVDDDLDVCNFIEDALKEIKLTVRAIQNEDETLDILDSFHPDLLLLDINLPHYNGWKLLQTIRADLRYQNLIVIIITATKEWSEIEKAYSQSGDEIILKPLNKKNIQSRVLGIAKRQAIAESFRDRDKLTGYFNENAFDTLLTKSIWNIASDDAQMAFVLVSIDHFENIMRMTNSQTANKLIITLSNALSLLVHEDSLRGNLGNGTFALVFESYDLSQVESFIHPVLLEVKKKAKLPELFEVRNASCSSGIAWGRKSDTSLNKFKLTAEELLNRAEASGGNTIRSHIFEPKKDLDIASQSEIIIIEDDPDVVEILSHAYSTRGYKVRSFHSGNAGLQYFSSLNELSKKCLIVLDRNLPDMDGIDILRSIKKKFPHNLKAIFLTGYSAEKDILEGLHEGAIDYISKPFSIPILLQKTHLFLS